MLEWHCGAMIECCFEICCELVDPVEKMSLVPSLQSLVVNAAHENTLFIEVEHVYAFLYLTTSQAANFAPYPDLSLDLIYTCLLHFQVKMR